MGQEVKICQNCKKDFIIDEQDFAFYEKIKVPTPTWCPECRMIRRFLFMNLRSLYKHKCDLCGKDIISMISPKSKIKVYCNPCWWSDKWDSIQYGRGIDFSKSFLKQVNELKKEVPHMALESNYLTLVNSEYINYAATSKNCYLIYLADECENILYSEILLNNKDCIDGEMYRNCELSYWLINCEKCYKTFFCEDCKNCQEIYFSKDCNNCSNCFGCIGLRGKQFYIFNQPYSKEDYFEKLKEFNIDSYFSLSQIKKQVEDFWQKFPKKFSHELRNLNASGDYIYESKNSKDMFIVYSGAENCRYCQIITMPPIKDCYDYVCWGNNAVNIYEATIAGEGANSIKFSLEVWPNVRNIEYSDFVGSSSNMFGCSNIRNKQYCILNKQYSKEEYEKLVPKIIQHMNNVPYVDKNGRVYKYGEFFPAELSPFGYNETLAQEYFPLTKEQALEQGYAWKDPETRNISIDIKSEDLPDHIKDVKDDIIGKVIECANTKVSEVEPQKIGQFSNCTQAFKIIPQELEFYRKMNLPLPRLCPNCRHYQRLKQRNPLKLWHRQCMCQGSGSSRSKTSGGYTNTIEHFHKDKPCPNEFETSYAPERPEIVYCEECYKREVE